MHLFYTPEFNEQKACLNREESHHCINVMRLKKEGIVYVTNGRGDIYRAKIEIPDPAACYLKVLERTSGFGKRSYRIDIGICPTKNRGRFETFIEKSTEIGIDKIKPLLCRNSEKRKINTERIEKIITSAMKQSLKAYRPQLEEMNSFTKVVKENFNGQKFIASESAETGNHIGNIYKPGNNALILIGAEGGFSDYEMELAAGNGFIPVSLGEYRLRTETAGIVSCHAIHLLNSLS